MMYTWDITAETELATIIDTLATELARKSTTTEASVLALHGDVGAGKTTFMQHFARALGVTETVVSPTFVIMKHYPLTESAHFTDLYHLDAYRIEDVSELVPLGFSARLAQPQALIAIEWAERIAPALPAHTLHLTFTIVGATRRVTLTTPDHG